MKTLVCPTCGCSLVRLGISKEKSVTSHSNGKEYHFCCQGCADLYTIGQEDASSPDPTANVTTSSTVRSQGSRKGLKAVRA